ARHVDQHRSDRALGDARHISYPGKRLRFGALHPGPVLHLYVHCPRRVQLLLRQTPVNGRSHPGDGHSRSTL
ncbi:MAG: hypothetical protein AVDCRST_MAG77-4767, partial [uncultured Chloroflexi bacterium]